MNYYWLLFAVAGYLLVLGLVVCWWIRANSLSVDPRDKRELKRYRKYIKAMNKSIPSKEKKS